MIKIKEIKKMSPDSEFSTTLRVKTLREKTTTSGKPYLDLRLNDVDDVINAKIWDVSDDTCSFSEGDIIKFKGRYDTFNDMPQIRILPENLHKVSEKEIEECKKDIFPYSVISVEKNQKILISLINKIEDKDICKMVCYLFRKYKVDFSKDAAALTFHDSGIGGLLEHTVQVALLAEDFYYKALPLLQGDTTINHSVVLSSAIIHDIAKIKEYQVDESGLATGFTFFGNLEGHIVGGIEEVHDAAIECGIDINSEKYMLIKHCLLSHHGKLEHGAPKEPACLEALIVAMADECSAKIKTMAECLNSINLGEFTEREFKNTYKSYYKPAETKNNPVYIEDILESKEEIYELLGFEHKPK